MGCGKEERMGAFSVEVKMKNWPRFMLPEERHGEDIVCEALVDASVFDFCVAAELVERLNLIHFKDSKDSRLVELPDGEEILCHTVGYVELEVRGRMTVIVASELPEGCGYGVILGRRPLSELDWHISDKGDSLVPNPLSPDGEPIGFV